jgi:hypothetical protein
MRFLLTSELRLICSTLSQGEVTEWPIVHPWKGCVGVTPPRVRIPPSPPLVSKCEQVVSPGIILCKLFLFRGMWVSVELSATALVRNYAKIEGSLI